MYLQKRGCKTEVRFILARLPVKFVICGADLGDLHFSYYNIKCKNNQGVFKKSSHIFKKS